MKPFERAFDKRIGSHWISYVTQSALAAISVFVVCVALRQYNLVVAVSLAATAFTVFAMPSKVTASARNVIGGQLVGLVFGMLCALIPQETVIVQDLIGALAVGGSMLVMAATNTEHPPAAGTALGLVMSGFSWRLVLGVIAGVALLSLLHWALRTILRDLVAVDKKVD